MQDVHEAAKKQQRHTSNIHNHFLFFAISYRLKIPCIIILFIVPLQAIIDNNLKKITFNNFLLFNVNCCKMLVFVKFSQINKEADVFSPASFLFVF